HRPILHPLLVFILPPPRPTPFPYTTLFRSSWQETFRSCPASATTVGCTTFPCLPPPARMRAPEDLASAIHETIRSALPASITGRSEEHTTELQSLRQLVCRLPLAKPRTLRQ